MEQALRDIYYDPKQGYLGITKLYEKARKTIPNVTLKEVIKFHNSQTTNQLNKEPKPKHFDTIVAFHPMECVQMDLMIYDRFMYKGFKYILVLIDVYSRLLRMVPLKSRDMEPIINIVNRLFQELGYPTNINTDQEFNNQYFNAFLDQHNITPYFSQPNQPYKNAIVERVNRTIAHQVQLWRTATDSTDWPSILPDIEHNYNNTVHSTIKQTPQDVFDGNATPEQHTRAHTSPFKVNDRVRYRIHNTMAKGDAIKWSTKVYTITEQDGKKYRLTPDNTSKPLKRVFTHHELQLVESVSDPPSTSNQPTLTNTTAQRKQASQYKRQVRTFQRGHEVQDIDEQGQVTYKPRLQPAAERRQPKPNRRYRKSQ